jgi:hypothetical protein
MTTSLKPNNDLRDGSEMSALDIQKHYQSSAAGVLKETGETDEMAHDVVKQWGRILMH